MKYTLTATENNDMSRYPTLAARKLLANYSVANRRLILGKALAFCKEERSLNIEASHVRKALTAISKEAGN